MTYEINKEKSAAFIDESILLRRKLYEFEIENEELKKMILVIREENDRLLKELSGLQEEVKRLEESKDANNK